MQTTSSLETVTIYREGAVCTRRAKLDGQVPAAVRVVGLPLSLVPGSLRAKVLTGPVGLRVLDVRPAFDVAFGDAIDPSAEVKARDASRLEVHRLEAAFQRFDAEVRELQALKPRRFTAEEGAPPRPAPVEAALALASFVDERLRTLLTEKRQVEKALKDAREALQLSERRLAEASAEKRTQNARVTRAVAVTLSMATSGPVEVEIEYQVPGVRWVPNYTLRLERGFTGGSLSLRASVAQDTGEDWKGVALALSTAALLRRTDVPELKSLRVGRAQLAPQKPGFRAPPPGLDELFEGYDASGARVVPEPPAAPPPPKPRAPPPMPEGASKKEAFDETEGGMVRSRMAAKGSSAAPRAPGALPPPRSAAPSMAMPARRSVAAPRGGGFGASLGGMVDGSTEANEPPSEDLEMADELASMDYGEEEPTGGALLRAPAQPEFSMGTELLDYDRLEMMGAEQPGSRGRLSPANPWASVFAVGVSVQVDVVMLLIDAVERRASSVGLLAVRAGGERGSVRLPLRLRRPGGRALDGALVDGAGDGLPGGALSPVRLRAGGRAEGLSHAGAAQRHAQRAAPRAGGRVGRRRVPHDDLDARGSARSAGRAARPRRGRGDQGRPQDDLRGDDGRLPRRLHGAAPRRRGGSEQPTLHDRGARGA
jgi:hypothetical protein